MGHLLSYFYKILFYTFYPQSKTFDLYFDRRFFKKANDRPVKGIFIFKKPVSDIVPDCSGVVIQLEMGRGNVGIFVILRVRFTQFSAFSKMLLSLGIEFYFQIRHYFEIKTLINQISRCEKIQIYIYRWIAKNFYPKWGLHNGAMGTVKEIAFEVGKNTNNGDLPEYVVVHFKKLNLHLQCEIFFNFC